MLIAEDSVFARGSQRVWAGRVFMLSAAQHYPIMRCRGCASADRFIERGRGMEYRSGRVGAGMRVIGLLGGLMAAGVLGAGCASEKPNPMAQPSLEQVKGNADRGFDKLKQEEREHKPAGM